MYSKLKTGNKKVMKRSMVTIKGLRKNNLYALKGIVVFILESTT